VWQRKLNRAYHSPVRSGPRARQPLRLPSVTTRVAILGGLLFVVVGVLVFRLWFLQVLDAQEYLAQA
jgi:penicillin-binding protein 2